jgi:hypothetical protein
MAGAQATGLEEWRLRPGIRGVEKVDPTWGAAANRRSSAAKGGVLGLRFYASALQRTPKPEDAKPATFAVSKPAAVAVLIAVIMSVLLS